MHKVILTILNTALGINFIVSEVIQDIINTINDNKIKEKD